MKYRLKKWYPSLGKRIKEGDVVKYVKHMEPYSYMHNTGTRINGGEVENNPKFWERVKEKNYEILSFYEPTFSSRIFKKCEDGKFRSSSNYPYTEEKLLSWKGREQKEIYSVKRLSDGEVFTVGDKIVYINGKSIRTLFKFKLKNDTIYIGVKKENGAIIYYHINHTQHAKQLLFTTEDGVDIYEGDRCWFVNQDFMLGELTKFFDHPFEYLKYFSTITKAEEWIEYNKPQYSKSDVIKAIKESYVDLCGLKDFDVIDKKEFKKKD